MPAPKDKPQKDIKERLQADLADRLAAGDWARAVAVLEELSRLEPSNIQHRLRIGDAHLKLNNHEQAVKEYYRAAEAFTADGLAVKAMAVYKMILRMRPDDAKAHEALHALRPTVSAPWAESGVPRMATEDSLILPLFASLTREQFNEVVERLLPPQVFAPETAIVREGDPGDALYIIIRGRVKVVTQRGGREITLAELGENEFFGELSPLTDRPRIASVIAAVETEALMLKGQDIAEITTRFPAVKNLLIESGLRRLRQTLETLKE